MLTLQLVNSVAVFTSNPATLKLGSIVARHPSCPATLLRGTKGANRPFRPARNHPARYVGKHVAGHEQDVPLSDKLRFVRQRSPERASCSTRRGFGSKLAKSPKGCVMWNVIVREYKGTRGKYRDIGWQTHSAGHIFAPKNNLWERRM